MSASSAIIKAIWRRVEANPRYRFPAAGCPFHFSLTQKINFPSYWPPHGVDYDDAAEGKPELSPRPYTTQDLDPLQNTFTPTRPLRVGDNRWAQVYLGTLRSQVHGTIENAVLKMYDLSCYGPVQWYLPEEEDGEEDEEYEWGASPLEDTSPGSCRMTDELMAWTEAWAYRKMVTLQGGAIPRFIDSFRVRLPGSESEVYATAMSYIPGIPFAEFVERLPMREGVYDDQAWYPLARDLFKAVYDFHQLDICEFDLHSGNVLVVPTDQASNRIATPTGTDDQNPLGHLRFIDFTLTRPTRFACREEKERSGPRSATAQEEDVGAAWTLFLPMVAMEERAWSPRPRPREWKAGQTFWKFVQWMARYHPGDAWVVDMWQVYWRRCGRYSPSHTLVFCNKLCLS